MQSILRKERLSKLRAGRKALSENPRVERYLWFRHAMDPDSACLSMDQVHELIELYDLLEQISIS